MVEPFAIAVVPVEGGGRIGISRLPGRSGELSADIATIAAWGAALVVSLTGQEEMARLGAGDLPDALASAGLDWRHFPIRDFGTPARAEQNWAELAAALHAALDGGGAILLHCAGGCGRSGMVALRLMTERGMDAEPALALIRAVRPCAVETKAQMRWGAGD